MPKSMKTIAIIIVSILFSIAASAQSPKHEVRAVWLTTIGGIDWPRSHSAQRQRDELTTTLDKQQRAGVNPVLLQPRIRATTIFPSAMEPWDYVFTGQADASPGYDPLQLAIDECHRRGMELHAWVVTIPVGKWNGPGCRALRKKNAALVRKIGDEGFMNPEQPQTADYLARFCADIVSRYDVDGIHLDYIRYPEQWPKARQRGEAATRRQHITAIVGAVSRAVKSRKPWVRLSCSPIGKYADLLRYRSGGWNALNAVSQDAQLWLRQGLMDQLYPMMYFRDNQVFPFAIDWQEQSAGRTVVPGLGIYFLDPREGRWTLSDVTRQMQVARQIGMGHCFFRSKFLTDNVKGIYDFTCYFNQTPALTPPLTWMGRQAPLPPSQLSLADGRLCWQPGQKRNDSPHLFNNIYASDRYPVDVTRAENLVATRVEATRLSVPARPHRYYAVTATDRYGLESEPCQMGGPAEGQPWLVADDIIRTDGRRLLLPEKPSTLDAQFLVVQTLQGQAVKLLPYDSKYADISSLPEGIYSLRTLGRKGRNHRLFYFSIRRRNP